MINIVVTSKPVDGLFYYSYEYCSYLNSIGVDSNVVVICHRKFNKTNYIESIRHKYIHFKNVFFDDFVPNYKDISLIMGRSMMTLAYQDFKSYSKDQQKSLHRLFSGDIISVYSENHPTTYPLAVNFFSPKRIIDLCDTEVYPNGIGDHFEKRINFEIFKPFTENIQFKYLFLGTNKQYYKSAKKVIDNFSDHGILTYNDDYIDIKNNNIFVPVENLMSMFKTYVYTKETFDPAPRIIQECKYFNKKIIYSRDKYIVDGGSVYWKRDIKKLDITPIVKAVEKLV
jgi:hypothetical protein